MVPQCKPRSSPLHAAGTPWRPALNPALQPRRRPLGLPRHGGGGGRGPRVAAGSSLALQQRRYRGRSLRAAATCFRSCCTTCRAAASSARSAVAAAAIAASMTLLMNRETISYGSFALYFYSWHLRASECADKEKRERAARSRKSRTQIKATKEEVKTAGR